MSDYFCEYGDDPEEIEITSPYFGYYDVTTEGTTGLLGTPPILPERTSHGNTIKPAEECPVNEKQKRQSIYMSAYRAGWNDALDGVMAGIMESKKE